MMELHSMPLITGTSDIIDDRRSVNYPSRQNPSVNSNSNMSNFQEGVSSLQPQNGTNERQEPSSSYTRPREHSMSISNRYNLRSLSLSAIERSRRIANNITATIEEITPHIVTDRVPSENLSWLNRRENLDIFNSYVINFEGDSRNNENYRQRTNNDRHDHYRTTTDNYLNNIREAATVENQNNNNNNNNNVSNNNNNNNENRGSGRNHRNLRLRPEVERTLLMVCKYCALLMLLLIKYVYDYRIQILNFVATNFFVTYANKRLRREVKKQRNRSLKSMFLVFCYLFGSFCILNYRMDELNVDSSNYSLTLCEMIWTVIVYDFHLKFITMAIKSILICIPLNILTYRQRGVYFSVIETLSQSYRCIAPMQPWLYYLYNSYEGAEKIFGTILSLAYILFKGSALFLIVKQLLVATYQLVQNELGNVPTQEQIRAVGNMCAICHDEFSSPLRLKCKHIFCEPCLSTWLDRERTCPLCRASVAEDLCYKDGHTMLFIQMY